MSPLAGKARVAIPTPPQSALGTGALRRRQRILRLNAAIVPGQAAGWSKFIGSAQPLQGARLQQRPARSGCIVGHAEAIEVRPADDVVDVKRASRTPAAKPPPSGRSRSRSRPPRAALRFSDQAHISSTDRSA